MAISEIDVDELAAATPAPARSQGDLARRVEELEARVAFLESLIRDLGVETSTP